MLRHPIHASFPAVFGGFETVVAFKLFQGLLLILRVQSLLLLCSPTGLSRSAVSFPKLHVGKTNGIIQIKVGSEIPFSVIGIIASNIISVEREESLVWGHPGSSRVEESHQMIVHVPHAVTLEAKLCSEIQEDVLYFLL
jgi:hypothetical protein